MQWIVKELGNTLTGDSAAAARYIEARLSTSPITSCLTRKPQTGYLLTTGGIKNLSTFPIKFPLLLAQGGEGIAVGLACKMLPHNFIEIIDASMTTSEEREFN